MEEGPSRECIELQMERQRNRLSFPGHGAVSVAHFPTLVPSTRTSFTPPCLSAAPATSYPPLGHPTPDTAVYLARGPLWM